jgi:hypothetical protein
MPDVFVLSAAGRLFASSAAKVAHSWGSSSLIAVSTECKNFPGQCGSVGRRRKRASAATIARHCRSGGPQPSAGCILLLLRPEWRRDIFVCSYRTSIPFTICSRLCKTRVMQRDPSVLSALGDFFKKLQVLAEDEVESKTEEQPASC